MAPAAHRAGGEAVDGGSASPSSRPARSVTLATRCVRRPARMAARTHRASAVARVRGPRLVASGLRPRTDRPPGRGITTPPGPPRPGAPAPGRPADTARPPSPPADADVRPPPRPRIEREPPPPRSERGTRAGRPPDTLATSPSPKVATDPAPSVVAAMRPAARPGPGSGRGALARGRERRSADPHLRRLARSVGHATRAAARARPGGDRHPRARRRGQRRRSARRRRRQVRSATRATACAARIARATKAPARRRRPAEAVAEGAPAAPTPALTRRGRLRYARCARQAEAIALTPRQPNVRRLGDGTGSWRARRVLQRPDRPGA